MRAAGVCRSTSHLVTETYRLVSDRALFVDDPVHVELAQEVRELLGLDHIAIIVRDIDETVARAGDTVDGRAVGERLRGGDIDLQFLLFGETRLELIESPALPVSACQSSRMARLRSSAISDMKSTTSKTPKPN